ncbi:MAG TPA: LysE family transporter [Ochrobactrum intermedium]|uniref:LysE family transporter n=1 Tax=Brucella intermedia TaxID=94625 RepID=A0A7V6P9U8_9HYPH|nr:LysE family transporter [Brucella intermedia]HHV67082.1 LysE family transporter [Brucella intermedia]
MTAHQSLLALSGIFLLACCSPGPVFLLIASTSAHCGRVEGVRVALGVAGATFAWATFTVLGLGAILASLVWAQTAIRLFAGAYLLWVGACMIRSSLRRKSATASPVPSQTSAFAKGFIASIINPKALAFFGSAFALTAPAHPTAQYHLAAVVALTLLSALWHSALACIFATPALQRGYQSMKRQIDLFVGGVLAFLGGGMFAQGLRRE